MESLKKYVDDNVSELKARSSGSFKRLVVNRVLPVCKDFISTVAKKLPMPVRFSSEPRRSCGSC